MFVAGLSGAGKSQALDTLSDLGYFTVEHLPVPLVQSFIDLSRGSRQRFALTALLLDIDSEAKVTELLQILEQLGQAGCRAEVAFIDCQTERIVCRYSETRRPHPAFDATRDKTIEEAIERERGLLGPVKERASFIVDTTRFTVHDLRREIKKFAASISPSASQKLRVNFVSFGYRHGLPADCDLVIDVRFLPNPHFVDSLREKTGLEPDVKQYVLEKKAAREFVEKYLALLDFLIPHYIFEGKSYLNIGVGCTGGRHRSVAIAEALFRRLDANRYLTSIKHRDLNA